jgi:hypothetical protein
MEEEILYFPRRHPQTGAGIGVDYLYLYALR